VLDYGPSCPQPVVATANLPLWGGIPEPSMSEDCLVLNVWTPSLAGPDKPVLVFLHGGGWVVGSGSWPAYDGTNLASQDSVVVTLNHRLGILGHLALGSSYGERFASSGNAGILDIVLALEWVAANIAVFGGDPRRVTVFGQSGGGYKLSTLLAMPSAARLIHRAVIISGASLRAQQPEAAAARAERALAALGVPPGGDPGRLQNLPYQQLLQAAAAEGGPLGFIDAGFEPVVQPGVLPDHPADALAGPSAADIPLIMGSTRHEMLTFLPPQAVSSVETEQDAARFLPPALEAGGKLLLGAYLLSEPGLSPLDALIAVLTDQRFRNDSVRLAEARLRNPGTVTYMYEFSWLSRQMRAAHGVDTSLWFGNAAAAGVTRGQPEADHLAALMSGTLIGFARHGVPVASGLPAWPPYSGPARETLVIDVPPRLAAGRAVAPVWDDAELA
jgi:para-nitrobenzyl esterase